MPAPAPAPMLVPAPAPAPITPPAPAPAPLVAPVPAPQAGPFQPLIPCHPLPPSAGAYLGVASCDASTSISQL